MGGESYSSVTTDSDINGAALFTGEVKDIPFLGRKYKQTNKQRYKSINYSSFMVNKIYIAKYI